MRNFKKTLKWILAIVGIILLGSLGVYGYNMGRLMYTDLEVLETPYLKQYYVVLKENEEIEETFKKYMVEKNWIFIDKVDNIMIFKKGNIQKEVPIDSLKIIKKYK
ncbi:hypothetical protein [Clostridium chauvoei]|uniref:Uncharacterized protein n=2 Tax=Clostridium chauvoei TaxID=46867 RepID=S6ESJ0_9CLOT|nr:hypothetical protein [Clostridium chauvoei]ATD55482.1 hypothetical protein BTM20_09655 [Clostridium chauvoei]ATD56844.1 hypothetical protein BTM21_03375 [Clostridium chauvoei]MBX7280697.1 hypothetical protein [Clostridium chauvoei]MBX7283180.1 hypothetical protein [Clostridium chauvoei]MBX7285738.1 hypothetical protein [Clostridium chauvoei]